MPWSQAHGYSGAPGRAPFVLKGDLSMSDDRSPADRRQPYSDRGGPEGRHAETHDVRREELTNPVGPQSEDTSFAEQLAPTETRPGGGHVAESVPAVDDKDLYDRLPELTSDELSRLQVL